MIDTKKTVTGICKPASLGLALATSLFLAACGDSTSTSGSGAGDGESSPPDAASPLLPFVGVYDLNGNWKGDDADQALLVIRTPESDGRSAVALYDFAENDGCYDRPQFGVALEEPIGDRIFMNQLLVFDEAVLDLTGTTLGIEYFDTLDNDNDGDTSELRRYDAPRIGITEVDIVPAC